MPEIGGAPGRRRHAAAGLGPGYDRWRRPRCRPQIAGERRVEDAVGWAAGPDQAQPAAAPAGRSDAQEPPLPETPDDPNRGVPGPPLAEILGILPPEARKVLRNLAAAPVPSQRPRPPSRAASPTRRGTARKPPTPAARRGRPRRGGVGSAQTTVAAPAGVGSFAQLPQAGTDWWQFVRRKAVVAVRCRRTTGMA